MKRKLSYLLIALILLVAIVVPASAQFGIGTTNPDPSAALDIVSTTQGVLTPRLTTAQRDAISSPAEGLTLYNTTDKCLQVWDGAAWNCAVGGGNQTTNTPVTISSSSGDSSMSIGELTRGFFTPSYRGTNVVWLDNSRFLVLENYQQVSWLPYTNPWGNAVVATIYDVYLHQLARFTVPVDPDAFKSSLPLTVVKLKNDNLMFAGLKALSVAPYTEKFGILIITQAGTVVTPWQDIPTTNPVYTGSGSGFSPIQDLVVLDNGNVLLSGIYVNNIHRAHNIVLRQDGSLIRDSLYPSQALHSDSHGVAATSFGFACLIASYNHNGSSSPEPLRFALYDFDGNLLAEPTFESDTANPFGPAAYAYYSTVALARVTGNTLYAGVKRAKGNSVGNDEFQGITNPVDHMLSGVRKFDVSATGVITVLNDTQPAREIGSQRERFGKTFAAAADGRLFAFGSVIPDIPVGGYLVVDKLTQNYVGASVPILRFAAAGTFSGTASFAVDGINNVPSVYKLSFPWQDFYGGRTSGVNHLLLSPDGTKLFVSFAAVNPNGVEHFYTVFDVSSGELVPYTRSLIANGLAQELPKRIYVDAAYDNLAKVEVRITQGAGTLDTLDCPTCSSTTVSGNYAIANKRLTLTNASGTATTVIFSDKLRYMTFTPDGPGTRTLEVTATDKNGGTQIKTVTVEVVAP